jgi:hypothetical protein
MESSLYFLPPIFYYAALAAAALGVLLFLYLFFRLLTLRDYKARYDFVNQREKNLILYGSIAFVVAGGLYGISTLATEWMFLLVGVLVAFMFGTLIGVIIYNFLEYYYPTLQEKRLQRLRYKPRTSPKSGKPMKLLSENEEDVHLDEGQQAEENIFSVDYDVWVDEASDYVKVEKYRGHLHAEKSPTCGYYTLRVVREEIIESPTTERPGTLVKHYECSYTKYKTQRVFNIAPLKKAAPDAGKALVKS